MYQRKLHYIYLDAHCQAFLKAAIVNFLQIEAKAIEALKDIPVRMISYGGSNYNISFLIRKEDKVKALQLLSSHLF